MLETVTSQPIVIKETYMDLFGHMNNALYLTLFEQARWDLITERGYGLEMIRDTGLGPTILEAKLSFMRELRLRDVVVIDTQMLSYERKVGKLVQKMRRGDDICCTAEFTFGLFCLEQRKLVLPTPEWQNALGILS